MKLKTVTALIAVLPALFLAPVTSAAPKAPLPGATAVPRPEIRIAPKAKTPVELTMKNHGAMPGEKHTYEAVLKSKSGDAPLANKKVLFQIERKNGSKLPKSPIAMGEGSTDATGTARVDFTMVELPQASYTLKASFAGDVADAAGSVESTLLVVKAVTKIDLQNMIWGTYKGESGSAYGTIGFTLLRTSDNSAVPKPMTITVNGQQSPIPPGGYQQMVLMPLDAKSWKVKIEFAGDDSTLPSSVERTFHRPAS